VPLDIPRLILDLNNQLLKDAGLTGRLTQGAGEPGRAGLDGESAHQG
jgi:hypothetical protein